MAEIIKKIIKDLKRKLISNRNIVSLTIVGSFSNSSKPLTAFNDLDIVIICKKFDSSFKKNLEEIISQLKEDYSSYSLGMTHSFKIGPIKIPSKKSKTIMLHFLIYTEKGYEKYESPLTRFSFQHYSPLLGRSLYKINHISSISVGDLFNEVDGIPAIKQWITKKEAFYIDPSFGKVKIIKIKLSGKLYLEVIFYSILTLSSNMLRTSGIYTKTNLQMCKKFKKKFPIKLNDLPYKIYTYKKRLRMNNNFSKNELKKIIKYSKDFVEECEDYLSIEK